MVGIYESASVVALGVVAVQIPHVVPVYPQMRLAVLNPAGVVPVCHLDALEQSQRQTEQGDELHRGNISREVCHAHAYTDDKQRNLRRYEIFHPGLPALQFSRKGVDSFRIVTPYFFLFHCFQMMVVLYIAV